MARIRRIGSIIVSMVALGLSLLMATPGAFAVPVAPPAGGDRPSGFAVPPHTGGLQTWQVVLIALAAASLAALGTAVIVRSRVRSQLRPAVG